MGHKGTNLLEISSSLFTVIMGAVTAQQFVIFVGCVASVATILDRGYSFYKNYKNDRVSKKDNQN
jgi:uncharacterized membrane protein YebE (DUF533 family)